MLGADLASGFRSGLEVLPVALGHLRARVLAECENLSSTDWLLPSRCHVWSVHEVVRHVRDACAIHLASLQGEPTPFSSGEPFDTQESPRRWLRPTEAHTPEDTMRELRASCAAEALALDARLAEPADELVDGPYGRIHWTVFSAHVFWDAWLHARDVTEVLGAEDRSTPAEEAMVTLYGLLIASAPAVRLKHPFDLTVALRGSDGETYTASVAPGRVTLRIGEVADEAAFRGELAPVADALAGRGPALDVVLHGDGPALLPLTWLRSRLAPAA